MNLLKNIFSGPNICGLLSNEAHSLGIMSVAGQYSIHLPHDHNQKNFAARYQNSNGSA
jgi:hypothetical protein